MAYQYKEECRYIWNNLVPKTGQSDNLQGELLRQIEKLAWEAQNNGNINWDYDFEFFCDFLKDTLCNSDVISDDEKKQVSDALNKIKTSGQYAKKFNNGEISDEEIATMKIETAYVEEDLYDIIRNAIGCFYAKNKELISYETNPNVNR